MINSEVKDSFVLYASQYEPIKGFSFEQKGMLLDMIFRYKLGEVVEASNDVAVNIAFGFFKNQLDIDNKKYLEKCMLMSENGKKGGRPKKQMVSEKAIALKKSKKSKSKLNDNDNDNDNEYDYDYVNDNDNDNVSLERGKKRKAFLPPTIEEVKSFIIEKGYLVNAEIFCSYYDSNGWMIGKNKMKDWRKALNTWNLKEKQKQGNKSSIPLGTTNGQTILDDSDVHKYDNTLKEFGL